MKLILPKEHGAWAMWIAPYIIGISITSFKWVHLLMVISIFFAYISIHPFLQGFRRKLDRNFMWKHAFIYALIAAALGLPVVYFYPSLLFVFLIIFPSFLVNFYFVIRKNERALVNDLAAMFALNSTFLVSYYLSAEQYDWRAFLFYILNVLFFFGSALYVKSLFRQKDNKRFRVISFLYMFILPFVGFLFSNIYLTFAYLFSTIRFIFTVDKNLPPKKVGIIEIINSLLFIGFLTAGSYYIKLL